MNNIDKRATKTYKNNYKIKISHHFINRNIKIDSKNNKVNKLDLKKVK